MADFKSKSVADFIPKSAAGFKSEPVAEFIRNRRPTCAEISSKIAERPLRPTANTTLRHLAKQALHRRRAMKPGRHRAKQPLPLAGEEWVGGHHERGARRRGSPHPVTPVSGEAARGAERRRRAGLGAGRFDRRPGCRRARRSGGAGGDAGAGVRRRDLLWRTGRLGGRELLDHVAEKRRRGQYVNGLERGYRRILVRPSDL